MKPTSLLDRMGQQQNQAVASAVVSGIADAAALSQKSNFQVARNDAIVQALTVGGFDSIMKPSDAELVYVDSVFQSKGFHTLDGVTSDAVDAIGRQEFVDLNNKLKRFTDSMQGVKTAGLFSLIDDLSKDIQETDIEGIWNKAVNAKPTLLAYILSIFDRNAKKKSISKKLQDIGVMLGAKSGNLKDKLAQIEKDLTAQKQEQEKSVKMLEDSFEIYYNAFLQLRKQFALIVYLEFTYQSMLEQYKKESGGSGDIVINKKLQEYERIFADIQNKRLLLHKTLLQLPLTAQQSNNLIGVCKGLIKEVDNTILVSLPSIRASLVNVSAAIQAEHAFLGNESAQKLEENLAKLSSKVSADLTVRATTLASSARLREANTVASLVSDLKDLTSRVDAAKAQSQADIASATNILTVATSDLKQILDAR